ncbi:MAG: sigma-54 dependent transcriptional regulator, partial [Acidobacteria bacterium]|nr:sigma-54 dependent transcriptional regulator [Acidobacteriota bacterium]
MSKFMASESPTTADRPHGRILVVDDERSMRELLMIVLRREGHRVLLAENGQAAVAILERDAVDVLICDIKMPGMSGVDVLREAKRLDPDIVGIMVTAYASTETAVEALRLGAYDYLAKPFDVEELKAKVNNALERRTLRQENVLLKRALRTSFAFSNIIGRSKAMQDMFDLIETVAPTNSTILVTGESGTGKELVARAIHVNSLRRDHPFVALNCGALPETLLESELFGHMRGAFTGAAVTKKGLLEAAERGTVFLDEISEMSPMMQVKLLRVLQERKFRRVGGNDEIEADIRIIAATNRDLPKAVADGTFREDLFYRINVIPIQLPPLRDRREDITPLAEHFTAKYAERAGKTVTGVTAEALRTLEAAEWPGNVRQLENVIERAVALERTSLIQAASLPPDLRQKTDTPASAEARAPMQLPESGLDLTRHLESQERELVAQALKQAGGRHDRAAKLLGLSPR